MGYNGRNRLIYMSAIIKKYNIATSQWEAILVGEPGESSDVAASTKVRSSSANWDNSYTIVNANSATWGVGGDDVDASTKVRSSSANWDNSYTIVNANSATWGVVQMPPNTIKSNITGSTANPVDNPLSAIPNNMSYITVNSSNFYDLSSSNISVGIGGRSVHFTSVTNMSAGALSGDIFPGNQWLLTQLGAGVVEIVRLNSNYANVLGDRKTGGQNKSIHVQVLSSLDILVTGGVA